MKLTVGRVGRAHGIRGDVAVEVRTDSPDERFAPGTRLGDLTVESTRWHSGRLLVHFAGVDDRTAAEGLRGRELEVEVPDDEETGDPDEFFDHQLVGLEVRSVDGSSVGVVESVVHLPMQDVLSVRTGEGGEVLVPFVSDVVPEVDLPAGRVTIDPPEGLLG